jgi:PAS domain S-box-containing protein
MAIDTQAEVLRLRTALRDVVALSTIPAAWVGREPLAIAAGLADVLVGSLLLDFAFVRLCDPNGGAAVEVTRGNTWKAFPEWLERHIAAVGQFSRKEFIPDVGGGAEPYPGIVIPIGVNAEGGLVAVACDRTDFPTEVDQLLLSVATKHAATACQNSRLIHERRSAEEALRESEHRWRSLTEALPQLVWAATPDGACDYFSTQWIEYTGVPESELLGWRWMDVLHPDDREPTRQFWMDSVSGRSLYDVEYRVRQRDGVYGWFQTRGTPIRDSDGNIVKWFGTCTDITDRKRAEEALRQSEQELRTARNELEMKVAERTAELRRSAAYLAEAQRLSRTGSFGWNVSTGELVLSEQCFRILEYDPATTPSVETVLERVHPDDITLVRETVERASLDGKDFEHAYRLLMPDGSGKYVHVVARAVGEESDSIEFIGAVMDITARKQGEEALRIAQAELAHVTRVTTLGELTSSIAHEVNQPLAAIVTNGNACLRWLAGQPPNLEEARLAVGRIIKDGHRASEVIGRIRALVKKTPPQKEWLDINEILFEVIALARSEVQRHRVSLQTQLSGDLPLVRGDRIQLQQVVLNLVINGIEAMCGVNERPRQLRVRSEKDGVNGVLVAVRDSGIGLDTETLAHLFDPFYTTKSTGMGMGLAISRSIIEGHGGRIWAEPNAPQGAVFQFTLLAEDEGMT